MIMEEPLYRSRAPIRVDLAGGWTVCTVLRRRARAGGGQRHHNRYTYATLAARSDEKIGIAADFQRFRASATWELEYDGNLT